MNYIENRIASLKRALLTLTGVAKASTQQEIYRLESL